ncbi:hypothetical protein ACFVIM_31510 [Streptomyces sp. NPDC057638]|uniref:hypothetical protein n=1 Tax=Streptomyces sp. NPDC057638 TaxID=3346190 RepID=UPI003688281C
MAVNRRRSLTRSAVGTLAVGMMAAVGAVATAPAAQAETAPSGQVAKLAPSVSKTFKLPKGVTTFKAESGSAKATVTRTAKQAQLNITCTLYVYNPYYSAGYVNGYANVSCTSAVSQIRIVAGLYLNNWLQVTNTQYSYGSSWVSATAQRWYSGAGWWQTGSVATIWFPPGYSPPVGNIPQVNSAAVWI